MVRPPDDLHDPNRRSIVLGAGTTLDTGEDAPLMSDAIRSGDLLFLSGRAAVDPATGALRADDFAGQLQIVLGDALRVLAAAGSGPEHVLRVECWLADRVHFPEWNAQFAATFPPPRPARTTLVAEEFPVAGLLVEIQITAAVPG
jgi:2-iminobutanoate/2-iminopropanoate deaminase